MDQEELLKELKEHGADGVSLDDLQRAFQDAAHADDSIDTIEPAGN